MSTVPTEEELKAKAIAPRVTSEDLEASIKSTDYYVHPESCLTICIITMQNGFQVTGESACAYPANFNKEIGEQLALAAAKRQIWPLLGYVLKNEWLAQQETTFIQRLEKEVADLNGRLNKLITFLGSEGFGNLPEIQRNLLYKQKDQMWALNDTLNERLHFLKV